METEENFGRAVRSLLQEKRADDSGRYYISELLEDITFHRKTLEAAMGKDGNPSPDLIGEVAKALDVGPTYFAEYRMFIAREALNPARGFKRALAELKAFKRARAPEWLAQQAQAIARSNAERAAKRSARPASPRAEKKRRTAEG